MSYRFIKYSELFYYLRWYNFLNPQPLIFLRIPLLFGIAHHYWIVHWSSYVPSAHRFCNCCCRGHLSNIRLGPNTWSYIHMCETKAAEQRRSLSSSNNRVVTAIKQIQVYCTYSSNGLASKSSQPANNIKQRSRRGEAELRHTVFARSSALSGQKARICCQSPSRRGPVWISDKIVLCASDFLVIHTLGTAVLL